jgi:hypothetical protein
MAPYTICRKFCNSKDGKFTVLAQGALSAGNKTVSMEHLKKGFYLRDLFRAGQE